MNKVILVADTCHAGAINLGFRDVEVAEDLAAMVKVATGLYILSSSKSGEESIEDGKFKLGENSKGHGAFTYALIKGILGEANYDRDRHITVSELFNYVAKKVPRITEGKQHPYARIQGTDLPLVQVK